MKESRRPVLTDDELLAGLADGSDEVLNQLYRRYFPMILHFITTNSGSEDDAKDIYQEAIVVLYEKVRGGSLELYCQLKTYIYSVSRRLWLKQLAQRNRYMVRDIETPAGEDFAGQQVDDDFIDHEERDRQFNLMADSLARLGEPCRTLLEDFYIQHLSMQEITEKFGYTNADNAKTQKYKCLMRLKRLFFSEYKQS
ncbi:sigma-70 family RNA polymerase sigma factor [Spirosoma sp. SC4-14]|uniref:RNA polymerase sigma factor n=1 Tax=Spirosoma sp. SC4-14 TaxID=3128900 RepID=UPI0030CD21CA